MITFERLMQSFITSDISEDLMIDSIEINHKKQHIKVEGTYIDVNGFPFTQTIIIPFYDDTDDLENNAEQVIVKRL